jgi:hypothetical protein
MSKQCIPAVTLDHAACLFRREKSTGRQADIDGPIRLLFAHARA